MLLVYFLLELVVKISAEYIVHCSEDLQSLTTAVRTSAYPNMSTTNVTCSKCNQP